MWSRESSRDNDIQKKILKRVAMGDVWFITQRFSVAGTGNVLVYSKDINRCKVSNDPFCLIISTN